MHRIFILIGKSASGKDSIYRRLIGDASLPLSHVVPYTTRPIRTGEMEGREYHFVTEERFHEMEAEGKVIEARRYDTCYGPWYYFTADDGQIDLEGSSYLLIGTLESYIAIRDYYGEGSVVPLYVEVDDTIRLARARQREEEQAQPKFDEMERRFAADEIDFSEEKLRTAGITKRFENLDADTCASDIRTEIRSWLNGE